MLRSPAKKQYTVLRPARLKTAGRPAISRAAALTGGVLEKEIRTVYKDRTLRFPKERYSMGANTTYLAIEGHADNWEQAIRTCGEKLVQSGKVGPGFTEACLEREKDYPTGLPSEIPVAIPHGFSDDIRESSVCFLRTDTPVRFTRMDDDEEVCDTRLIFNIAVKPGEDHLNFLQQFMNMIMDSEAIQKCLDLPLEEIPVYLEKMLP